MEFNTGDPKTSNSDQTISLYLQEEEETSSVTSRLQMESQIGLTSHLLQLPLIEHLELKSSSSNPSMVQLFQTPSSMPILFQDSLVPTSLETDSQDHHLLPE